jgi:hypothetical protein
VTPATGLRWLAEEVLLDAPADGAGFGPSPLVLPLNRMGTKPDRFEDRSDKVPQLNPVITLAGIVGVYPRCQRACR